MKLIKRRTHLNNVPVAFIDTDEQPAIFTDIAYFNGNLSPREVREVLEDGRTVYTSFNNYRRR